MEKITHKNKIIILIVIGVLCFMTLGFAIYNETVYFGGTATLKTNGKFYISSLTTKNLTHATASPEYTDDTIDFNLSFTTTQQQANANDYKAVFEVTITNDTFYDYKYNVPSYTPRINRQSNGRSIDSSYIRYEVDGMSTGDIIRSKTNVTFTVTFYFTNPLSNATDTFVIDGDFATNFAEDYSARLEASLINSLEGDLRGNIDYCTFTVKVMNTYEATQTFTISIDDESFRIISVNGSSLEYTIDANDEQEYEFYVAKVDGAEYISDTKRVNVSVSPIGLKAVDAGRVTILVDQNATYDDYEAPKISNVNAVISNTEGNCTVSWNGQDANLITDYKVIVYKNGTEEKEVHTNNDDTSILIEGLSEANYYFIVVGTDSQGNTATASDISNASTTEEGYAAKSATVPLKWNFTVTYNLTNLRQQSGGTTAKRGESYTGTITATGNYNLPTGITVTMVDTANPDYTYNRNNGSITIRNVTGNITITATGTTWGCLVEGTEVLLANGKYKNIEDIKYTDLLRVYDHVNGGLTNVYPIWIEEEGINSSYQKITFSDGSILKVVNSHSLFDVNHRKFVDVADFSQFNIGTEVYKIENDKLKVVEVTKIEYIQEEVKYYNILSTVYYNIIANNFLTADTTASISNIYGFKENAIYGENYYKISQGPKLEYESINFIPYYMYKGFNLQNAGSLLESKIDMKLLNWFINGNTVKPITKKGERYFIVTTSLDDVNERNVDNYLYKEGSIYILPSFKGRYFKDTSDGKIYYAGESLEVSYNTHLEAIY